MFFYHPDIQNIGNHRMYSEGWKGYVDSGANCIAKLVKTYVNSPLLWKHGIRKQENFKMVDWIALDVDEGLSLLEAQEKFKDYIHVIGTTKSHQIPKGKKPACDRYRVFLRLEHTCRDLAAYRYTVQNVGREVDADEQAFDGARMFQPCKEIISVKYHGRLIKLVEPPKLSHTDRIRYEARLERVMENSGSRRIPPFIQGFLRFGTTDGQRNNVCFKIGGYLALAGFSEGEIVDMILDSPIPVERSSRVVSEVTSAVRSGMKKPPKR